ncbi:MAG: RES family NAD+ phosphorylase [Candidatus Rokuibacteriota bacterium]
MIYDRQLLDKLDQFRADPWRGEVFRHMFGDYPPERENQRGARWNPPETPAIYTSLTRAVALAEAEFQIALQPVRPKARRTVYRVGVTLSSVVDLSDRSRLRILGISEDDLTSLDHRACQRVGGAVEWLGNDGLMVPSARADGANLVIFPNQQKSNYEFRVMSSETIEEGA